MANRTLRLLCPPTHKQVCHSGRAHNHPMVPRSLSSARKASRLRHSPPMTTSMPQRPPWRQRLPSRRATPLPAQQTSAGKRATLRSPRPAKPRNRRYADLCTKLWTVQRTFNDLHLCNSRECLLQGESPKSVRMAWKTVSLVFAVTCHVQPSTLPVIPLHCCVPAATIRTFHCPCSARCADCVAIP